MLSRMSRLRLLGAALAAAGLAVGAALAVPAPASAAALTEVTNFGTNPSNLRMYLYVPDTVAARPALLVAVTTTAPAAARPCTPAPSSRPSPTGTATS